MVETPEAHGQPTFSFGIWKSVSIVTVDEGSAAITHVVPHVYYKGTHLRTKSGERGGPFEVQVAVHLRSLGTVGVVGTVTVIGGWQAATAATAGGNGYADDGASILSTTFPTASASVTIPPTSSSGEATVHLTLHADQSTLLWWPNGMGKQVLYNVTATFTPSAAAGTPSAVGAGAASPTVTSAISSTPDAGPSGTITAVRRIGFRTIHLVTGNDTNPAFLAAGGDGSANMTMLLRVNGAAVFARGSNHVPLEELEGRASAEATRRTMVSAAEGGMNTVRLWAGGIYEYSAWCVLNSTSRSILLTRPVEEYTRTYQLWVIFFDDVINTPRHRFVGTMQPTR